MRVISLELAKSSFSTRGFITRKGEFGEKIQVLLYNNGVKIDFTKEQPEIVLKGLNSKHEYAESTVSIENGKAVLTMDQDWNAVSGTFETAYFEVIGLLSGENVQLSTVDVDWYVLPEADISEGQEAVYVKKLERLLLELQEKTDGFLEQLSEKLSESDAKLGNLKQELQEVQVELTAVIDELREADFYTKEEMDEKLDAYVQKDIPENANLDDYQTEGEFSKKTPTVVTGAPEDVTGAFRLSVKTMLGSSGVFQTLCDYGTNSMYFRIGNTSLGFDSPWEKVSTGQIGGNPGDVPETLVDFGEGFESYAGQKPIFYKQNGRVYIEGACSPTVIIPKTGGVMFSLPEGCRPSTSRSVLCQGSEMNVWLMTIERSGQVKVLRYRATDTTSTETDIPAGAWLPFVTSFKAAE